MSNVHDFIKKQKKDFLPLTEQIHDGDFEDNPFPDLNYKFKPLATITNLEFLLKKYGIECCYDEILKKENISFPDGYVSHADLESNGKLQHICSLLELNGIKTAASNYIPIILMKNSINPILDFIESKPWDGKNRILNLCDSIPVSNDDYDYTYEIVRLWLIQCVAAADGARRTPIHEAIPKYELTLVFQGNQGSKKTSWFKSLVPKHLGHYIIDGVNLDLTSKDSVKTAISAWITELGELDSTFKKSEISQLKAFLSKTTDQLRLPYDKRNSDYQRRTSFCGSVNDDMFLVDKTGNRRYAPIKICGVLVFDNSIDLQQLWAQVFSLYLSGEQWWPDDEINSLMNKKQERHKVVDIVSDSIQGIFNVSSYVYDQLETLYSLSQIADACLIPITQSNLSSIKQFMSDCEIPMKTVRGKRGYRLVKHVSGIDDAPDAPAAPF